MYKTNIPSNKSNMKLMLLVALVWSVFISDSVFAQSTPTMIDRAQFSASPLNLQRKYVENMPGDFMVHDLVNYPVSRTPDAVPRPGVTYMTVYDFYYNVLPGVRLDALLFPASYFISVDSLSIPNLRTTNPAKTPAKTTTGQ